MKKNIEEEFSGNAASGLPGIENLHKNKTTLRVGYPNKTSIVKEQYGNLKNAKRIMIDFDGVIHKYTKGFQDGSVYDDVVEGSSEKIKKLKELGFEIVIFTTRVSPENSSDSENQKKLVEDYLNKNNIPFDHITSEKLGALAYIDDNAIEFKGNWFSMFEYIIKNIHSKLLRDKD